MFNPKAWPSVEYDLAEAAYHQLDLMSASRLKVLEFGTSMHLDHQIRNPREDNEDMMIGRALHTYCLRRAAFNSEFAVSPKFDGRTKDGKAAKEQFALENAGKCVLNEDQMAIVTGMAEGIMRHEDAYKFVAGLPGRPEVSVFCEIDGILAKSRFDRMVEIDGELCIVDIKSTRSSAGRREFERTIWSLGYALQALFYSEMAFEAGLGRPQHFVFVAVEKSAPHVTACYRLREDALAAFEPRLDALIARYKDYLEHGPKGYEGIEEIAVPAWALRELETETGETNG